MVMALLLEIVNASKTRTISFIRLKFVLHQVKEKIVSSLENNMNLSLTENTDA